MTETLIVGCPERRRWDIEANHTMRERARIIAEVAMADTHDNALKVGTMLPRATLRVLEVLEMYEKVDKTP